MKCIKNHTTGEVRRVSDREAAKLAAYGWTYVTKAEFKAAHRAKLRAIKPAAERIVAELRPKAPELRPTLSPYSGLRRL